MTLPNDPAILIGVLNTKLRDFYKSLDELCDDFQADKNEITRKCAAIGYEYDESINQFI